MTFILTTAPGGGVYLHVGVLAPAWYATVEDACITAAAMFKGASA